MRSTRVNSTTTCSVEPYRVTSLLFPQEKYSTLTNPSGNLLSETISNLHITIYARDIPTNIPLNQRDYSLPQNVANQPGLTEFTIIKTLPKELRDQIWEPALPESRIVSVTSSLPTSHPSQGGHYLTERIYASQGVTRLDFTTNKNSIPNPLLHRSREA